MRWLYVIECAAAAGALLSLGACGPQPAGEAEMVDDADTEATGAAGPTNEAEEELANATLPVPPGEEDADGGLPPAEEELRFVGLWATEAAFCANRAWQFTPDMLRTPAGSQCSFSKVTPVSGGYDIAARCTAEAPPSDEVIQIRFAESARAMLFESDAIADAGLIYCGPLSDAG